LPKPLVKDYNGNTHYGPAWPGRPKMKGPTAPMIQNQGKETAVRRQAEIEDVSGTILVFDCGNVIPNDPKNYQFEIWDVRQTHCAELPQRQWQDAPEEVKVGTRHSGGFMAVFCDGHAHWQPGPEKIHCGMWSIEAGD